MFGRCTESFCRFDEGSNARRGWSCRPGENGCDCRCVRHGYGNVFGPLPGTAGGRDDEQRFAERNELGKLGLGMDFGSGAVRVTPVEARPSSHGQVRKVSDLRQGKLIT